ncbi:MULTISPECIES: SlyX family protein [Hyphobacterium]|uniref:SlyX family protein n=1 Tax=Hyphobacterium vulgare TaxID=1736751 RepID=A0ABV7A0W1_9PROT
MSDTTSRLDALESHVAEQQRAIDDLSDVVARQQREIDRLTRALEQSHARLGALEDNMPAPPASEKPPHW